MIELRRAEERGKADFGWLQSKHSFSFGSYYDATQMGFSVLRVINDDRVAPGAGFDTHGHREMEIISLVTKGTIEHKDSIGNIQRLPKGEFQLMSAGKGVFHSEYNGSKDDNLEFLQIWIVPNEQGGIPGYQQKDFGKAHGLTAIVTPTGKNGTLKIKQDANLSQIVLAPSKSVLLNIVPGRKVYLHQIEGALSFSGITLTSGNGAKLTDVNQVELTNDGEDDAFALFFDLP
jgi:redox-sensitive bicupin YhaK (pirin superfamily)